jgi:transcriptional regulator with XRE-family HTH domain
MLAEALGVSAPMLGLIEAGAEVLQDDERRAVIPAVARVTRVPEEFFSVDFSTLVGEESPEATLARLVPKVESFAAEMYALADRFAGEVARWAQALDQLTVLEFETSQARQDVRAALLIDTPPEGSVRRSNLSEPEVT